MKSKMNEIELFDSLQINELLISRYFAVVDDKCIDMGIVKAIFCK